MNRLTGVTFTNSGTWTCPAGITEVILTGRGGSGGGAGFIAAPYGNGGSGCFTAVFCCSVVPGTTYTVTIGAGGLGGLDTVIGSSGGDTTFGALATFKGGSGGEAISQSTVSFLSHGPIIGGGIPLYKQTSAAMGSPYVTESTATSGGAGDGSGGILAAFSGQSDCNGISGGGGGASSVTLIPGGSGTAGILNIFWVE